MRRILYIAIPVLVLVGLVVWRLSVNARQSAVQAASAKARKNAPITVRVATATVRDIVHTFQGVGNVEAPADVRISPQVTGRLTYLRLREGDPVKRGEVIARLDPTEAQAAVNQEQAVLASAQANLRNAEIRYNRIYSLYKQGFTAAQDVDDARTTVDVQRGALNAAQAQLRNLQGQLGYYTLRAPVNGFVTARFFDPGSVVSAGQPILTVQAMRRVFVETSAPAEAARSIRVGMTATAVFDELPNRTFTGTVRQVNASADPQSRQFLIRAAFANPGNVIRPGMFCRVTVITSVTHDAVVVPREAVKPDPKGQTVTLVGSDRKARVQPVKTGDQDVVGIQITQGVQPGQQVVVLAGQPLKNGQAVRVDTSAPPVQTAGQPTVMGGAGGAGGAGATTPPSGGAPAPSYGAAGSSAAIGGAAGPSEGGASSSTSGANGSATSGGGSVSPPAVAPQTYNGVPSGAAAPSFGGGSGPTLGGGVGAPAPASPPMGGGGGGGGAGGAPGAVGR